MAKSNNNTAPASVLAMLPRAETLEQKLGELIIEGRRIVATLRFLDEVRDIELTGPPLELDEAEASLHELAEALPELELEDATI
jgi:hypothetical protein